MFNFLPMLPFPTHGPGCGWSPLLSGLNGAASPRHRRHRCGQPQAPLQAVPSPSAGALPPAPLRAPHKKKQRLSSEVISLAADRCHVQC